MEVNLQLLRDNISMQQFFICTGLSFADLATVIGKDEVWDVAVFYGQVRSTCMRSMSTVNTIDHSVRPISAQNKSQASRQHLTYLLLNFMMD